MNQRNLSITKISFLEEGTESCSSVDQIFNYAPSVQILHINKCTFCRVTSVNLKRLLRKWSWFISRHYPIISLKYLRDTTKILSQDSLCHCQDSNQAPPESKPESLLLAWLDIRGLCSFLSFCLLIPPAVERNRTASFSLVLQE
jgi:hypothetical protein